MKKMTAVFLLAAVISAMAATAFAASDGYVCDGDRCYPKQRQEQSNNNYGHHHEQHHREYVHGHCDY
jgi:hypothetical protein